MPSKSVRCRWRSVLFVPAEERRLAKVGAVGADAYVIDLEDSVGAGDKEAALERAIRCLGSRDPGSEVLVRINKGRSLEEASVLRGLADGFMLPKFDSATDYAELRPLMAGMRVIAMIESPKALLAAAAIAALGWVDGLAFGAEDFTASTGIANCPCALAVPKAIVALSAKASGKAALDTPCFRVRDREALEGEVLQARELGFDGKLAIHPGQIGPINRAFAPRDARYLRRVLDTYEASGDAVCEIDGAVYERPHIDRIKVELAAARTPGDDAKE